MSVKVSSLVWADESICDPTERLVLLALADHCDDSMECFPSVETLARKSCMEERSVYRVLSRLTAKGKVHKVAGGGRHHSNRYRLGYGGFKNPDPKTGFHSLNPDPGSPFKVENPDPKSLFSRETLTLDTLNPDPGSGEPSLTINNTESAFAPSLPKKRKATPDPKPTIQEFVGYGASKDISDRDCREQFEIWEAQGWKDGNGTAIRSWKGKLLTQKKIGNLPSDKRATIGNRNPVHQTSQRRSGICTL